MQTAEIVKRSLKYKNDIVEEIFFVKRRTNGRSFKFSWFTRFEWTCIDWSSAWHWNSYFLWWLAPTEINSQNTPRNNCKNIVRSNPGIGKGRLEFLIPPVNKKVTQLTSSAYRCFLSGPDGRWGLSLLTVPVIN